VCCGRRWGKTTLGVNRITETALAGLPAAWFAPGYKYLAEAWRDFCRVLRPVIAKRDTSEHRLELITGGSIDFWTISDGDAGRGRKYARVAVDEAAKGKTLAKCWTEAIRPTLTDLQGEADFYSTPKGRNEFWRLFTLGQDPHNDQWESWQLPTAGNPFIPPAEIAAARRELPDRVYRQEYLAEFIEEAGGVFRCVSESIDEGRTQPEPRRKVGSYAQGVDLARLEDFTVITVLDNTGRQVYFERFNLISWERQIEAIKAAAVLYNAVVIVDATGIGDPIVERLGNEGLRVEPYTLTNASKKAVIDELAMGLERGRFRLMDIPEQTNELLAYQYELTPSRLLKMSAPEGMHDDTVIALALAAHGAATASQFAGAY
jgi:hypothetical protein